MNSHIPYEYTQSELSKILKPIKSKFKISGSKLGAKLKSNRKGIKMEKSKEPTIVWDQEGFLKQDNKKEKLGGKIKLL